MINFFIGCWFSISPLAGQSDTTSVLLVEWWHQTDINIASDISIYSISDSIRNYKIYNIYRVYVVPEGIPKNTYLFALVIEKIPYKTFCYCKVKGYDTNYFYHWGFLPNKIPTPKVQMKR